MWVAKKQNSNLDCCGLWYGWKELLWSSPTWCLISRVFLYKNTKINQVPWWYEIPIQSHMSYKFEKPFHICNLSSHWALSNYCDPFERITSYAHDQDHVHVHSHAILLHLEDSKYIHPPTNKTPCCTMSISLQSYRYNVWDIQKRRSKRCIPKEGMPHTHKMCQKKREKENIAHTKYITREREFI